MNRTRIGLELFNLGLERRVFSRAGFTTSIGRVTEHVYRALLFDAPDAWEYDVLAPGRWRHRPDETTAFRLHGAHHHRLFAPPSVPLVNGRVQSVWQRQGPPRFYVPHVRDRSYSLLQYTSELPWGDRPLAPVECCIVHDFYGAHIDPAGWASVRRRFDAHRDALWLTAVSEYTRQDAIRLLDLPPERVRTIHNAVDHAVYRPEPGPDDADCLKKWNLPARYVLYVGSVALRKNVVSLIRALENHNEHADEPLPLIIAGNVPGANYLVRRRVWNQIRLVARKTPIRQIKHPTDPEMAALYRGALMVVHPAVFEGFGLTVLEAMASGTPVVCGRHTSLIEVGGNAARFVDDPTDVEELAAAIGELADSAGRRAELRQLGIVQAAKFRWEFFARETIRFYQDALAS